MFGYKVNKIKIPNRDVRARFTYTKTANCCIMPVDGVDFMDKIPAYYVKQIIDIYNNGIRFWKSGTDIGNYTDPNGPSVSP